jgi:hypothetical protein
VAREGGRVVASSPSELLDDHRHGVIGQLARLDLAPTVDRAEDRPCHDAAGI